MEVQVRLFTYLRDLMPDGKKMLSLVLEENSCVKEILDYFGISKEQPLIIKVNGKHATKDTVLNDGDRVGIFPPVGGG